MSPVSSYKVKVVIGDAQIEIEGAEAGVVKIVEALSDVLRPRKSQGTPSEPPELRLPHVAPSGRSTPTDIRSFFAAKRPGSDVEASAVAAYFYRYVAPEADRRETINSQTLEEAFRLARRPLPAKTIYTLQNARNAGYLDSIRGGEFRLNPVGFNLVEHSLGGEAQSGDANVGVKSRPGKTTR